MALSLLAASCGDGSSATAPVDDGPSLVEVPSVIGNTAEFASGRLSAIGSPVIVERVDGLVGDPNIVVEQLPLPGSSVVVGSPVVLKVPGGSPTLARDLTESSEEPAPTAAPSTKVSATTQAPDTTATTQLPTTTTTSTGTTTTTQARATTTSTTPTTTRTPAQVAGEAILAATYQWGVYSDQTKRLQELLAVPTDGFYGHGTRTIHVETLVGLGLSTEGVPTPIPTTTQPPPTTAAATTTSAPPTTTTTIQIVTTTTTPTTTLWQTSTAGYMPEWGSGNYSFYAEAGDTVQVELVANGFNPLITLRHPDVWSVIFDNPDSTTASLSAGLCLGGDYTLHVSGEVPTDHGNYEWTVTLTNRNFDLSSCPYGSYPMINGWVAGYVAVFLERPCIADGDLSDCPPGTIGEVNQWFGPGSILG